MHWILTIQTQEGAAEHGGALDAGKPIPLAEGRHDGLTAEGQGLLVAETSPWIAIVDDDPPVLRALSRLLRSRAFRVETYGSGQEFLAALPNGLPKCLIVDFQMPGMNGLELHQHLMSNRIAIPTILITAHCDAAINSPSVGDTFVARLRKPLHDEALFLAIGRAIGLLRHVE